MSTSTLRIPEKKKEILKIIASLENRGMKDIIVELIDEYIERHQETLEILSNPHWVKLIEQGKSEIINKVKGINRVVYDISSKPPATIEWE